MKTITISSMPAVNTRAARLIAFVALFAAVTALLYIRFPMRSHWTEIFRPAALLMLDGKSPYDNGLFFNPPWALFLMMPFAVMPERVGWALYGTLSLFLFGFSAWRMGAKPIVWVLFMLLPQTLYNGFQVNVDAFVALGLVLPPQIGLFLILLKPQIGAGLALYWLIEAWQRGGMREAVRVFAPVGCAFLLSFAVYGPWISQSQTAVAGDWNRAYFPALVPVGLALLATGIKTHRPGLAFASSAFLSPYVALYSFPLAALGLLSVEYQATAAIFGLWIASLAEPWLLDMVFRAIY